MKVHENGRVVIPADIRRILDIEEGDEVAFSLDDEGKRVVLRKVENGEEDENES